MELRFKGFAFVIAIAFANAATLNSENSPQILNNSTSQNKTIDILIQEQTNLIKQIVADSKPSSVAYPIITKSKLDPVDEAKLKTQKEQESVEELRHKCHELTKLSQGEENHEMAKEDDKIVTVEAFGPSIKPQFLDKTPQTSELNEMIPDEVDIEEEIQIPLESKSETISPEFHRYLTQSNVQYVEFEPFVLQKIVLSTGQELFYWFKKYPTVPQFVSVAQQQLSELQHLSGTTTNQNTPVTTEKEKVPNYEIEYNPAEKIDNNLYKKQMKFVLPMKYLHLPTVPNRDVLRHDTSKFDPFAYYPKRLQPSTVQMTVPYLPTYHMVKALTLPNQAENKISSPNN